MHSSGSAALLQRGTLLSQARAAVVLLHGRGSSAEDIAGLATALRSEGVAFLAPSAAGGSWYPHRFLAPLADNEPWLSRALATVANTVRTAEEAGIDASRIGLIGFSQGACLALEYAVRHPKRYGVVAGLSGGLIGPIDTPRTSVNLAGTPVLVSCAEQDAHIPLAHVEESARLLSLFGASVTKQLFPGNAHTIFAPQLEWLNQHLKRL